MSFQNIYYKRTAATAKACYMCFRPTTTVLATLNTTDFFYTCDGHLTDQGFASLIEPPPPATNPKKVSDEEIRHIKEEWEERQKLREKQMQEKEKATENNKDTSKDDDKDASKESGTKKTSVKGSPPPPLPIPVPSTSAAAKPTHQRYTLHRDVWSMRLAEHKKKRQTTAVRDVAPRLPMTPRGGVA